MIDVPHRLRPASILVLGLVLAACASQEARPPEASGLPRGVLTITGEGPEVQIQVEIAETPEAKSRGLMGRPSLASDAGMVFLEEEPVTSGFWMKDTLIPLSVAFWDRDGRIFRILDMEPCREEPCPTYDPQGEWVGAVEVNQGFFDRNGIEIGDRVDLERS
jgi:uncharacterized membrane protein (UPF0127 family)